MTDDRNGTATTPNTVVVERGGSGTGIVIGIALLLAVIVVGYFLITKSNNDTARTNAVTSAAKSVGHAADKAGDAAQKAVGQ